MTLPYDATPKFQDYARPEMLVSTEWVAEHLGDPGLVVAESDEDVLLYETGHIPLAVKLDWHTELNDPVTRDYVDGAGFARLMSEKGISRDTTLVLYGDRNNWWAAYALWVATLFGHPDVRLLDGGRAKWIAEDRPLSTDTPNRRRADYPVVERDDAPIRAFRDEVQAHLGQPMIDVRSPGEYSGELLHMPDYPQEGALRGGHIPGAKNVPWARAAAEDATFRSRQELEAIYGGEAAAQSRRRRGRVLPDRRAVQPHLVRPAPPARLPHGAQLRRLLDRVGQQRPRPDHPGGQTVTVTLNPRLQDIVDEFDAVPGKDKLQLLLEFSEELPPLPARYAEHRDRLEPVPECQSPLFLAVEVTDDGTAHLFFDAPPEAPTTRGFASILASGLDGLSAEEILATPAEFAAQLGLADLVSPLRLRGMAAMLARIKRQIQQQQAGRSRPAAAAERGAENADLTAGGPPPCRVSYHQPAATCVRCCK